ncbi:MAG TPA: hypothetical protein VE130_05435 [Nitrososphaeraceae archaeon]|jgi:hypothetical protein|nr:hypothetical protein [Nitrososphaeraceae archaeon]
MARKSSKRTTKKKPEQQEEITLFPRHKQPIVYQMDMSGNVTKSKTLKGIAPGA